MRRFVRYGLRLAVILALASGVRGRADMILTIDVPGASSTQAFGINGAGQIVGQYVSPSVLSHGFLDVGGSFTTLAVPGASATAAFGINGAGQIVGNDTNSSGVHGFLDVGGSFTTIDVPGVPSTTASGINGAGQIVGDYVDSSGQHGFLTTVPEPSSPVLLLRTGAVGLLGSLVLLLRTGAVGLLGYAARRRSRPRA